MGANLILFRCNLIECITDQHESLNSRGFSAPARTKKTVGCLLVQSTINKTLNLTNSNQMTNHLTEVAETITIKLKWENLYNPSELRTGPDTFV